MLYHLPTFIQDSKQLCFSLVNMPQVNMPQVNSLALIFSQAEMENKNQTSAEIKSDIVNKTFTRKKRDFSSFIPCSLFHLLP